MNTIPVYVPQGGGNIPVYQPRQSGGGGFRRIAAGALRRVTPLASSLKDQAIERGGQALKNVASDVLEGKELGQALKDEGVNARVQLSKKITENASGKTAIAKTLKGNNKYSKQALNALFD